MAFKLIIAGGRDFDNYRLLEDSVSRYLNKNSVIGDLEIVCGKANGADSLGERYAKENDIPVKEFPANWELDGRKAGIIRNKQMAEYSDGCLAFWDTYSKGTKNMIGLAYKNKLSTEIVRY